MMWKSLMQNKNKNFFVEDISHSFLDCVKQYQKVIFDREIFWNSVFLGILYTVQDSCGIYVMASGAESDTSDRSR